MFIILCNALVEWSRRNFAKMFCMRKLKTKMTMPLASCIFWRYVKSLRHGSTVWQPDGRTDGLRDKQNYERTCGTLCNTPRVKLPTEFDVCNL